MSIEKKIDYWLCSICCFHCWLDAMETAREM